MFAVFCSGWLGLEILAFPCNQFGGQEPGTNKQIAELACTRFKAEYPIFGKVYPMKNLPCFLLFVSMEPDRHRFSINRPRVVKQVDVNGSNAAPLYKFLKSEKGGLFGECIKWNFTKFLVDKDGHVVGRFAPISSPSSIEVMV